MRVRFGGRRPTTIEEVLKLGAGGWVTGIDIAPDGVQVARNDTYGAHVRNNSDDVWRQVVTTDSMPAGTLGIDGSGGLYADGYFGCYEIVVAPSNSNILYMLWDHKCYKSTDRGVTWTATAMTASVGDNMNPNISTQKLRGRRLAVKPDDPDTVIACLVEGTFRTTNGGTSWTEITDLSDPSDTSGGLVAFDPSNSSIVYVAINGVQVERSTDAGASFTATSSGPTSMRWMKIGPTGVVMVTDGTTNGTNVWKYASGSWTNLSVNATGSNDYWHSVTPDPNNAGHWYFGSDGGQIVYTANDGTSFTSAFAGTRVSPSGQPGWLAETEATYLSNGDMTFDPSESNLLMFANGLGVARANPPTTATAFNWDFDTLGIEQLVVQWIDVPPGGTPIASCWDRPIFKLTSDNSAFPADHGPDYTRDIRHGWSWDYAKSDPSFCVVITTFHFTGGATDAAYIAYSSDFGATWTPASGTPTGTMIAGGSVAVATPDDWVWCEHGNDSRVRYTANGGGSFSFSTLSGLPTSGETGLGVQSSVHRRIACCDADGYFYIYTNGTGASGASAGVWKSNSPNDGSAFTKVYSGRILTGANDAQSYNFNAYNAVLTAVPGVAGTLFFTGGGVGGSVAGAFLRSDDAGVTWDAIPDVLEVWAFGYGKSRNGTDDPILHMMGWVDGDFGLWVSENATTANVADITWSKKSTYPLKYSDEITTVSGDINTYGVSYVGARGSGAVRVVWA